MPFFFTIPTPQICFGPEYFSFRCPFVSLGFVFASLTHKDPLLVMLAHSFLPSPVLKTRLGLDFRFYEFFTPPGQRRPPCSWFDFQSQGHFCPPHSWAILGFCLVMSFYLVAKGLFSLYPLIFLFFFQVFCCPVRWAAF